MSSAKKHASHEPDLTVVAYDQLQKKLVPLRKGAPTPEPAKRIKSALYNIKNVGYNALDKVIGGPIAWAQNKRTEYQIRHDQEKKIVYLMPGFAEEPANQWRYARTLRKEGYAPYHLKPHNDKSIDDAVGMSKEAVGKLHEKVGISEGDAKKRYDIFSGHSDGARKGMRWAQDPEIIRYGIKGVQARAPTPYGIAQPKTIGQKLIIPHAKLDNARDYREARELALEFDKNKLYVPVDVLAGKHDRLVTPDVAVFPKARKMYLIDDVRSTHFGTSGSNKVMNQYQAAHIHELSGMLHDQKYKRKAA